jgi:Thioesterase-like superfamily
MATQLASGPWDRNAQIGGAPAALLARAFERLPVPEGLIFGRLTYDFIRAAPIGPVEIRAEVAREGRRAQLLEGAMLADGVAVVRARALRLSRAVAGDPGAARCAPLSRSGRNFRLEPVSSRRYSRCAPLPDSAPRR